MAEEVSLAPSGTPAAADLFEQTEDGARLLGSRCASCRTPYFPRSDRCHHPDCADSRMEDARFGPRGKLWSWAVQNYPPPAPARYDDPYVPYTVGLVDLADGLRVLGRIDEAEPGTTRVGSTVELVVAPLCHEEDGSELISWMFRAVKEGR